MQEKPYRLPDPEKQPDSFLVILYKTCKKIPFNDRAWDKIYFARCMKRAQELLETFNGDVRMAAQCMQELKDRFEADDTRWSIETVIAYSFEWRSDHMNVSDRDCLRQLIGAYKEAGIEATGMLKAPERRKPIDVVPMCHHPGYPQKPGTDWTCPSCGEVLYTPKPGEIAKMLKTPQAIEKVNGGAA